MKTAESKGFPQPGEVFEQRYRIEAMIGAGGFAKVYKATQTDLGREVALKIMLPEDQLKELLDDSHSTGGHKLSERFLQEARLIAKLRDPHTVTMHDHGKSKNGLLYMVMEFIDGVPLSRLIKTQGAIEPRRVAKILRQALSSLQEAHAMGMLHRDIKPGNIMIYEHVGRPDQVKVLDFGIAKVVGRQAMKQDIKEDLTTNGALLGTPRYMSPEQIRGQELTPASDLYSLGLVAYECLTGHKAIESNSSVIVIGAQLDPRSFAVPNRPHIPPGIRMVVNRMLEKDRNLRYQTVDDILGELDRLDTGSFPVPMLPPTSNRPLADGSADLSNDFLPDISDSIEPLEVANAEGKYQKQQQRSRTIAVFGILAACLAIGLMAGFAFLQSRDEPVSTAEGAGAVTAATEQNPPAGEPVEPPVDPTPKTAEVEPPTDKPADKPADKPTVAVASPIMVETTPPGLEIYINDKSFGQSPLMLAASDVQFPANFRAVLASGESRTMRVTSALPLVKLDLTDLAKKKKKANKANANKRPQVRPSDDKKPADDGKKPEGSNGNDSTSTSSPNLVLPALD